LIIVVHQGIVSAPESDTIIKMLQNYLTMVRQRQIKILGVVTNMEGLPKDEDRQVTIEKVAKILGLNRKDVFPFALKIEQDVIKARELGKKPGEKAFETDLHSLMILERAVTLAKESADKYSRVPPNTDIMKIMWEIPDKVDL